MDAVLWAFCLARVAAGDVQGWLTSRSRGQGTIEYALMAAGIAVVALGVIAILSGAVTEAANTAANAVKQAAGGAALGK